MELNASAPYEFLDLTDIEDSERSHLLCTLYKTSQEDITSLNDTTIKSSKNSPHGTAITTYKDSTKKFSRYESSKFVKNIAAIDLSQQMTSNEKASSTHVVQNPVIPRFVVPLQLPFRAVIKPALSEVAVIPLRTPIITAGAAAKSTQLDQSRARNNPKALNQTGGSAMAQHTVSLHHSQQQQMANAQSQIQHQPQQQQQQQQAIPQNNNISNYPLPPPQHHSQTNTFNQMQSGGVFVPSHSGSSVGGAMYHLPAAIPGNVYVNNVTANVNLHGYMTHAVPQYIPGASSAYIAGDQSNIHGSEQGNQIIQSIPSGGTTRGSRRGRNRGNGGNRRGDYNQRQPAGTPPPQLPQEAINSSVDPQVMASSNYPQYLPYTYHQPFYGSPPQTIGHPQVQQATGTPLYLASHVPMYGPPIYNYHPGFVYTMMGQDYQMMEEKGDEHHSVEGFVPHIWHPHMQMEYPEEYLNPELVDDGNHNHPSPLTSTDTPSMLSPILSNYDQQLQQSMEIQQHMNMNTLHIYDTSAIPQQSLPPEQIEEYQQIADEEIIHEIIHDPECIETINSDTAGHKNVEHSTSSNSNESWTEGVASPVVIDYNIQPYTSYGNTPNIQSSIISTTDLNQNVSNIETYSEKENSVSYLPEASCPTAVKENVVESGDKISNWTNQTKKTTASVAVTATPASANNQDTISNNNNNNNNNNNYNNNINNNNNNNILSVSPVVTKIHSNIKTEPLVVIKNKNIDEKSDENYPSNLSEITKIVTTASIASAVVPQQLQEKNSAQCYQTNDNFKKDQEGINTEQSKVIKDLSKTVTDNLKVKKDEPCNNNNIRTSVTQTPASISQQNTGPPSWASLFASKNAGIQSSSTAVNNSVPNVVSKKPVAKVLPFEGTSNFTAPSPGALSYSAASAQGLGNNQQTLNNSNSKAKIQEHSFVSTNIKENIDEWTIKFADFLTKYKIDYTSVSLRPRGLTNRSNYCYINAILQALVGCPPFYNLMKSIPKHPPGMFNEKTNIPTISAMMQLIAEFSHLPPGARLHRREKGPKKDELSAELSCDPSFEPTAIYKLWNSSRCDVEGRQEDAEEFLGFVLNRLNDEMLEIIKLIAKPSSDQNGDQNIEGDDGDDWQMICNNRNKGSVTRQTDFGRTPLSDIFRGELRSRLQREGELSTDVIQPFFTLQLNIEKAASVKEALEILVGRDQLEGVTCSKTNQEVVAWQQMTLEKLPVVLILHLKWFDYKLDGCTKIFKTVEFPVELKIDTKILASKKNSQKLRLYRLFAVVYHDGKEASKGHYITDVYHSGYSNWLRFDDSTVKPISESNVLRPRKPRVPYLLYYRRCDTIPTTATQQNQTNK